jgi:two-component system response regulator YesN
MDMLKILLVDDESTVLQGLTHILSQYCPNYDIVGAVQNAADAMRLLADIHVDAVITDVKMPDMDGVELTKHIRSQYPEISVIVHSGYADFEFVRQTMKYGACDYLLKPCHYQSILDTLYKIEEIRAKEDQQFEYQENQELLKAALKGKRVLPANWVQSQPKLMVTLSVQSGAVERVTELLKEHWKLGIMLQEMEDMVRDDLHIVLMFPAPLNERAFVQKLNVVQQFLLMQGYGSFWGISDHFDDWHRLRHVYMVCKQRMEFATFNELPMIVNAESYIAYMEKQKAFSFSDYFSIHAVGKCLLKGDAIELKQVVEEVIEELSSQRLYWDPKQLKNGVFKEMLHLEEHLKNHGLRPVHGELIDYADEVKNQATFRDLMLWVKHVTSSFLKDADREEIVPSYIQTAVQFMAQNYMQDISLKTVSDTVFLNPWYFSTQFKKYMNVAFSEYVNQVRVRMAKQFLKQKDLKVYQVAEMVGFQDAAYFSTVFKSMEQMSPKDFQKTIS